MKNTYSTTPAQRTPTLKKLPHQNAEEALREYTPGGRIVGLTKGQFSLIHMITVMLDKIGPSDIIISTWSAGLRDSLALDAMRQSGQVRTCLLILDRSYSTRQPEYAVTVEDAFGKENIRTTNTHAKFVLMRSDTAHICIRSSMNLNKNDRCENFDLDDDPAIYQFYHDFATEIFEKSEKPGFIEKSKTINPIFNQLMIPLDDQAADTDTGWGNTTTWASDNTAGW